MAARAWDAAGLSVDGRFLPDAFRTDDPGETVEVLLPTVLTATDAAGDLLALDADGNSARDGTLRCAEAAAEATFVIAGQANGPSEVGDVVGIERLAVGDTVVAEDETVVTTGAALLPLGLPSAVTR